MLPYIQILGLSKKLESKLSCIVPYLIKLSLKSYLKLPTSLELSKKISSVIFF